MDLTLRGAINDSTEINAVPRMQPPITITVLNPHERSLK